MGERPARSTQHIADFASDRGCAMIAEVGVWSGSNARHILSRCGDSLRRLVLVDPWTEYGSIDQQDSADRRMAAVTEVEWNEKAVNAYRLAETDRRVTVIRATSYDGARVFPDHTFDMVYIDADHSYLPVLDDCAAWMRKVKPDGILAGHDYSGGWLPVKRAVDRTFGGDAVLIGNGSWYVDLSPCRILKYKALIAEQAEAVGRGEISHITGV